jgi:uracil-DNA glycosylase
MDIAEILKKAEKGRLGYCKQCPWSPEYEQSVAFGDSCIACGINWEKEKKANSMFIVQDPGDTTPRDTRTLCAVHNAKNPSDKTAQQALHLWNAAVSLKHNKPEAGGYLKKHYWTNAIMHGASRKTGLREKSIMKAARKSCSNVLALQIMALKPNVIVAKGTEAVNSLYEIDIIKRNWSLMRHYFKSGAYSEDVTSWRGLPQFKVFCTYHTSAKVVNQTLSKLYDSVKTEAYIKEKVQKLNTPDSINQFLSTYEEPDKDKRSRGMRFLLNHWIDIGLAIRGS